MDVEDVLKQQEEEEEVELNEKNEKYALPAHLKHKSIAIRPLSLGNWMFVVVADFTSSKPAPPLPPPPPPAAPAQKTGRRLTIQIPSSPVTETQFKLPAALPAAYDCSNRRHQSLQFTPTSPVFSFHQEEESVSDDDEEDGWKEKEAVQRSGVRARAGQQGKHGIRSRGQAITFSSINIETPS